MNARPVTRRAVIRAIEGITALCLGSSDCIIWIEQSDAAAFCDDEAIYLPRPTGKNDQEYELLLALALREVAKLWYTKAAVMSAADAGTLPFAAVVEEVRLKARLSLEFVGAPEIFNRAVAIASGLHVSRLCRSERDPSEVQVLTIWSAAHEALLETTEASESRAAFEAMALEWTGPLKLQQAIDLAFQAPMLKSSRQAVALGERIRSLLQDRDEDSSSSPHDEGGEQPHEPGATSDSEPGIAQPCAPGEGHQQPEDAEEGEGGERRIEPSSLPSTAPAEAAPEQRRAEAPGEDGSSQPGQNDVPTDESDSRQGGAPPASVSKGADAADLDTRREAGNGLEGSKGGRPGGADPLSDALAMLKGHARSSDCSAMAAAYRAQAMERASAPVSDAGMRALLQLLEAPASTIEAFPHAARSQASPRPVERGHVAANATGSTQSAIICFQWSTARPCAPDIASQAIGEELRPMSSSRRRHAFKSALANRLNGGGKGLGGRPRQAALTASSA